MAGGMHGMGCAWQGGLHDRGACVAGWGGESGRRDGHCSGMHPTGMHFCFLNLFATICK